MDINKDAARRVAIENLAAPGSASLYVPRDGELVRAGEAAGTVEAVLARLSESAYVVERLPGRVGPRGMRTAWPEIRREFGDLVHGGEEARARHARERNRPPMRFEPLKVARAVEAAEWPMRFLAAESHAMPRLWLALWMQAEAYRLIWSDHAAAAAAILAARHGVAPPSLRTANRRRREAAAIILAGLLKDGTSP